MEEVISMNIGLNSKMVTVSIIVPVYGVEKTISRCALSIFNQSFTDWEAIFVNDCTKDRSIEILQEIIDNNPVVKNKVKIVSHTHNRGLSAARNTGIQYARGEYLYHIDSDDYLPSWTLEEMVKKAELLHADIVVGGNLSIFKHKKKYDCPIDLNPIIKRNYIPKLLYRQANYSIFNKLIRRDLIIKHGLYSIEGISMGEDYVLYPRIAYYANTIVALNKEKYYSYYYVINNSSIMHTYKIKNIEDMINAQNILNSFFTEHDEYTLPCVLEKSTLINKSKILLMAKIGDYDRIRKYASTIKRNDLPVKVNILITLCQHKLYHLLLLILKLNDMVNDLR